jgi:HK97 family phage major capsid protein
MEIERRPQAMNQNELLQKALETADLIAGGGDLNPEQSEKFITYLHDLSVMAKDARMVPMKAKKREINKIGIGQRASVPAAEGTDPGVRQKPTFSKTVLDTVELMTPFEITYDVFEDNIEGDNL